MTIIEGIHYRSGKHCTLFIEEGRIERVKLSEREGKENLPYIAPGIVDLQVNGYAGCDFNTLPLQTDRIEQATRKLIQEGVTTYFPTVITNDSDNIEKICRSISRAGENSNLVNQVVTGIHLEGPFISPQEGPRGAHDPAFIQEPDWDIFLRLQDAANGKIKIITLSPEWTNANEFISKCVKHGVKVAIGHTAATTEQIQGAVEAGATLSTHLGNGAHSTLPRHPNYIWDQLASEELWASFVGDGFHLPKSVVEVLQKVKEEHAFLISDAVNLASMEP
jgi:N-acetylglucosamine-6-phosphate deacetylase